MAQREDRPQRAPGASGGGPGGGQGGGQGDHQEQGQGQEAGATIGRGRGYRVQGGCCRSGGSLDLPSERAKSPVKLRSSSSYTLISGERKHHNLQKLNPKMLENQSLEDLFFG